MPLSVNTRAAISDFLLNDASARDSLIIAAAADLSANNVAPDADDLFNRLSPYWLPQPTVAHRIEALNRLLDIAFAIEELIGARIHKGTPFYWLAKEHIDGGDLMGAMPVMYAAVEEDQRAQPSFADSPAALFIRLSERPEQAMWQYTKQLRTHVDGLLADSRVNPEGLTFAELDARLLQSPRIDVALHASFAIAASLRLHHLPRHLRASRFASVTVGRELLSVVQTCDYLIATGQLNPITSWKYIDLAKHVAGSMQLPLSNAELREINRRAGEDFSLVVSELLQRSLVVNGRTLSASESDIAITYAVRNTYSHASSVNPVVLSSSDNLANACMATVFYIARYLY